MSDWLRIGDDGRRRCWWPGEADDYVAYHDDEWGRPVLDDRRLFEKVCLEGFQSGLSWLTILRKREGFRAAFADFDPEVVAGYGPGEVERLLRDPGIVRHRRKIESAVNNAGRVLELIDEFGSFAAYVWSWEPVAGEAEPDGEWPMPSTTPTSTALAKDLKRRGWSFVGPTTVYAFMQAMGLVNDHVEGCEWREICAAQRAAFIPPG
jgi:DNA-3-methyladenine glycosylase I